MMKEVGRHITEIDGTPVALIYSRSEDNPRIIYTHYEISEENLHLINRLLSFDLLDENGEPCPSLTSYQKVYIFPVEDFDKRGDS